MSYFARIVSSAALLFVTAPFAFAAEELVISADQTQILKTSAKPGTIIIGSPGIVDASMQNGSIYLQGKNFGSTNIIILDRKGNEIANYDVTVRDSASNVVAIYKAGERYSYSCIPSCQPAPQVGDNVNYVYSSLGAQSARQENMMKSTSVESQPTTGGNGGEQAANN